MSDTEPTVQLTMEHIREVLDQCSFMDRKFLVMKKGDGFLIQMSYMEPDVEKPGSEPVEQKTRKYYISPHMCESELVETVWLMVQRSQLHVASEYFTYKGRRVYSQHFDIQARLELCDNNRYEVRD